MTKKRVGILIVPAVEVLDFCGPYEVFSVARLNEERRREESSAVTVEDKDHVVEDGHVLTSAGISAGIDLALRVVARCFGEVVGRATARHMEYPFPDDNRRRV
jgi:transcriptional regulator GlxA family with amidase domain